MMKHLGILLLLLVSQFASAQSEIIKRIEKSQTDLKQVQSSINQQANALERQIVAIEQRIAKLKNEAAAISRNSDEQLLSIDDLKNRIASWRAQANYQTQVLTSFLEQFHAHNRALFDSNKLIINDTLTSFLQQDLKSRLDPQWRTQQLISPNGQLSHFDTISLGPVTFAYNDDLQTAGLVSAAPNSDTAKLVIHDASGVFVSQLAQLKENGKATLAFDPTLGNAEKIKNQQNSLVEHIEKGGHWALPIIFAGVVALLIALFKALQLMRLPRIDMKLTEKLQQLSLSKDVIATMAKGHQAQLLKIALENQVSQRRDDLLVAYMMDAKRNIEKYLTVVATCASIAPLLGLLGTVSGMITTFMMMNTFGTSDAATVSGGISEALITTELGLIVAIPALILSALLGRTCKSYLAKLEAVAVKISKLEVA